MLGGTKNCPKGKRRVCVPINRQAEVIQLLKNPPAKKSSITMPNELGAFNEVLKQVRKEHPNMSYREAQKLASKVYKLARDGIESIDESRDFNDEHIDTLVPRDFNDEVAENNEDDSILIDVNDELDLLDLPEQVKEEIKTIVEAEEVKEEMKAINEEIEQPKDEEPLTTIEELAEKLGLGKELAIITEDVPDFKVRAEIIDILVDEFYQIEYGEKINFTQVLKDLPERESRTMLDEMLDLASEISFKLFDKIMEDFNNPNSFTQNDNRRNNFTSSSQVEDVTDLYNQATRDEEEAMFDEDYDPYEFRPNYNRRIEYNVPINNRLQITGQGLRKTKNMIRRVHKCKSCVSGGNVNSPDDLLKYVNSGYNGLIDIMQNVSGHVLNMQTIDLPACAKLYNVFLELEDVRVTIEIFLESGRYDDYDCELYKANHDITKYITGVNKILTMVMRRDPMIMTKIHDYFNNNSCGVKEYEYASFGNVRGSGFWGVTGKYTPNYYGHR